MTGSLEVTHEIIFIYNGFFTTLKSDPHYLNLILRTPWKHNCALYYLEDFMWKSWENDRLKLGKGPAYTKRQE